MLSGISPWSLLIILVIVALLFGTKRIRGAGSDLGDAIKNFRKAVKEEGGAAESDEKPQVTDQSEAKGEVVDAEVTKKESDKA